MPAVSAGSYVSCQAMILDIPISKHSYECTDIHSVHCITRLYNTIKGRERGGTDEVHREVRKEQKTVRGKAERK